MRRLVTLACVFACGCFSKPPRPEGSGDGGLRDGAAVDVPVDACAGHLGWTAPRHLTELDVASEQFSPYLSPDGLEIWFSGFSTSDSLFHVYRATRGSATGVFDPPLEVPELITNEDEEVFLSDDLLQAWVTHQQSDLDIQTARRGAVTDHFGGLSDIGLDQSTRGEADPTVTRDGLTMVLTVSASASGSQGDLAITTRASALVDFPQPSLISAVNTGFDDCCSSISGDGLLLLYASNRTGNYKIYQATRTDPTLAFGNDVEFAGQDQTSGVDTPDVALGRTGTVILSSDGGGTGHHLYVVEPQCLP